MENNLDSIIKALKETTKITSLKIDDATLFDNAIKIFISNNISNQKNKESNNTHSLGKMVDEMKMKGIGMQVLSNELSKEYPTDKQIELLAKYKINAEFMTRKQATEKIKEIIRGGNERGYRK